MNNYKEEKGITLISLIVTIVILIILATITITSIKEDALIEKVEGAKDKAVSAQEEDKKNIGEYDNYIKENTCTHPNGFNYEYDYCGGGSVSIGHWVTATCSLCGYSNYYYDASLTCDGSVCPYCDWDVHGGWRPDDYWNTLN